MNVRALFLSREMHLGHAYYESWRRRCRRFCDEVLGELSDQERLLRDLDAAFGTGQNSLVPILFVDDDGTAVGHALMTFGMPHGRLLANLEQYALDKAVPLDSHQRVLSEMIDYAKACGAARVYGVIPDKRVARAHRMFHGASEYATVMIFGEVKHGEVHDDAGSS